MTKEELRQRREKLLGPALDAARGLFCNPQGEKLLRVLELRFDFDPVAHKPDGTMDRDETLINVGAARVVKYLRSLATEGEKER